MNQRRAQLCTLIAALAIGCAVLVLAAPPSYARGGAWGLNSNALHQPALSHAAHAGSAPSILSAPLAAAAPQRRDRTLPQHYASPAPHAPLLPASFQRPPPTRLA